MNKKDWFSAGIAQRKITPEPGCNLGGYFHHRVADSVKSDLFAKAMVFENEGQKIAIVSLDLICMISEIAEPAKKKIFEKCNIHPDAVMICATHTHTGPVIRTRKELTFGPDYEYNAFLVQSIFEIVKEACDSMFNVWIYSARTQLEGYSVNKILRTRDGRDQTIGTIEIDQREIAGESGPLDTSLDVLCLRDSEKRIRSMAINFAAHPNAKGNNEVWAEWPGDTAKCITTLYGEDVPCLLLQGASGDIDCVRGIPKERVGLGVAGAAIAAIEKVVAPTKDQHLDYRMQVLKIPSCRKSPELEKMIEGYRKLENPGAKEKWAIKCYELWDEKERFFTVPIQVFRIGDIAMIGLPAEIFNALGLEIKKFSPANSTFIVSMANEKIGYIPTTDQADRMGYGEIPVLTRWLIPEAGRIMVDTAIELICDMWD
jgi:hypothetical protein